MDPETSMLQECQHIYSDYLYWDKTKSPATMLTSIDELLATLKPIIKQKSEAGANTIFLEKIESDFMFIRRELSG
jgi:hypothetical protein